jgi:hypothetical protein
MSDRFDFDKLAKDLAGGLSRRQALRRLGGGLAGAVLGSLSFSAAWAKPKEGLDYKSQGSGGNGGNDDNGGGNSACARWCDSLPPGADTDHCKSDAAQGQGLCYECGPKASAGHPNFCDLAGIGPTCCPKTAPTCCSGHCSDLGTDASNCGQCGKACPSGRNCCGGQCVDLTSDNNNCGGCLNACPAGYTCRDGQCAVCPTCSGIAHCLRPRVLCGQLCCVPGATCEMTGEGPNGQMLTQCFCSGAVCGGVCVATQTDTLNCGGCGVACTPGQSCANGQCTCAAGAPCPAGQHCSNRLCCPAGQTNCGGVCTDIGTDSSNCGFCGVACAVGQVCCGGRCADPSRCCGGAYTDTQTDPQNCGACGHVCPPDLPDCCGGACTNRNIDSGNCGACGNVCSFLAPFCCQGRCSFACTNCGAGGAPCNFGPLCCSGICLNEQCTGLPIP